MDTKEKIPAAVPKKTDKKPQKPWVRPRHLVVRNIAFVLLAPYTIWRYGIKIEKFKEKEDRPYFVLCNHTTPFDQFFLGISIPGRIYYVATEDIFSNGLVSSAIRYLIAPIPIKKQAADITAIRNCMKVAKEGGTIAIAPEGNRTYSGRTEYMSPVIASLARKLKMPIALYRIEGGYGVQPRWSDVVRRGKMRAYVSKVIQPEEYEKMTDDELFAIIEKELYVNETEGVFKHKKRAEYLERAIYYCPDCGFAKFESKGHKAWCQSCGKEITYGEDMTLTGVPYKFMSQWYDAQKAYVNSTDTRLHTEKPIFTDKAMISEVIINKRKQKLCKEAAIELYGDRIVINGDWVLPFEEVTAAAVLGRNKLNIYHDKHVYQFKGDKRFNALKYVNLCYRHKNILKGDEHGEFLGL